MPPSATTSASCIIMVILLYLYKLVISLPKINLFCFSASSKFAIGNPLTTCLNPTIEYFNNFQAVNNRGNSSLQLFQMCNTSTMEQAEINCNPWGLTLTGNDMECMSLFLTSSFNKEWEWLYLDDCHIQDKEFNFLYQGLQHSEDITINNYYNLIMRLGYNLLTMQY